VADPPDRRGPRAILVVAIVVVAIVAVSLLVMLLPGDDERDGVVVGGHPLSNQAAPEIDLVSIDGERVTLSSLRGRPVLINFWATWCPPCREEFPLMVQAYADHAEDGLEILGILHDDAAEGARAFVADQGANWPVLLDPDDAAWNDYLGLGLPTSFYVDADGIVRAFSVGPFTEDGLAAQLATILPEDAGQVGNPG
jgi:cytochrome c biogenesis protein CcmG, thiol:disulfide interchange protein DsbE